MQGIKPRSSIQITVYSIEGQESFCTQYITDNSISKYKNQSRQIIIQMATVGLDFSCQIHFEWLRKSGRRCLGHGQVGLAVSQMDLKSIKLESK